MKIFSRKKQQETKSVGFSELSNFQLEARLNGDMQNFLTYYKIVKPLQYGIDLITQAIQNIPLKIYDKQKQEWVLKHPFLDLFNQPNSFQDGKTLLGYITRFYLLTGNSYINATGEITREPLELYCFNPSNVNIMQNCKTGFVDNYQITTASYTQIFTPLGIGKDKSRFINQKGELVHWRFFTPDACDQFLKGISPLEACEEQIVLFELISRNNRSLLNNGMRLSGLLHYEGEIDTDLKQMQDKINNQYSGASKTGKVMISKGGKIQYQQLSQNIKDMDFPRLLDFCENSIYQGLKIPLDLVKGQSTYNNQSEARLEFYDGCVLPLAKNLMSFLTSRILKTRYKNSENLELIIDEEAISILKQRNTNNIVNLYKAGITTLNEARSKVGYEGNVNGGDTFYQPQTLTPMGTDTTTNDNRKKPIQKSIVSDEFIKSMQKAGYTEDEINEVKSYQEED